MTDDFFDEPGVHIYWRRIAFCLGALALLLAYRLGGRP